MSKLNKGVEKLALDPHTFGNSPAACILIDKLNKLNDPMLARRVIKFIQRTQTGFAQLSNIECDKWFKHFRVLWTQERMGMAEGFHPEIDTYIKNVISTDSKEWLRTTYSPKRLAKIKNRPKMDRQGNISEH